MKYSAGQAAKAAGVAKATITRALQSGKISGQKDENGAWSIDPAELHRVFPPVSSHQPETPTMKRDATPNETGGFTALERENQMLREALEDARQERDRWHQIADRLSLSPPPPQTPPKPELNFWSRLFGKGGE